MSKSMDLSYIFDFLCRFSRFDNKDSIISRYGEFDSSIVNIPYFFAKYEDIELSFFNNYLCRMSLNLYRGSCYSRVLDDCKIHFSFRSFDSLLKDINRSGLYWSVHSSGDTGDSALDISVELENEDKSLVSFSYHVISKNNLSRISILYAPKLAE